MRTVFLLLIVFFTGCAENAPKLTHWARLDGLRKAQHQWIETDFRQSEHYCQLAAGSHSNADPQFSYPQARTTAGADLEVGMANIARGETIRANRANAFEACMIRNGYFVEYSE